jgi:hypothetical protein
MTTELDDVDVSDGFWWRKWTDSQRAAMQEVMQIHLDSKATTAKQLDAYLAKRLHATPRQQSPKSRTTTLYVPVEEDEE